MTGLRVLIVEDEYVTSTALKGTLEEMGYTAVGVATTEDEAVAIARKERPDIILMDIELQNGSSGVSAAGKIKEEMDIPVIYLTAHSSPDLLRHAKITGPFGYMVKPYTNKELRANIEMALYKHRLERRLNDALDTIKESHESLAAILDGLNAMVYVADMDTYEVLFANKFALKGVGDIVGKICWQSIQHGQSGPCSFCTNDKLLDSKGNPKGPWTWEFQNPFNNKWYHVVDRAIKWNGRIVRLEIATNITKRKRTEEMLEELTNIDELTGIANRRGYNKAIGNEWNRAKRGGTSLSVVMVDIDYFKRYNDSLGHAAGDMCLRSVAQALKPMVTRAGDLVARYGGEEFVIILTGTDLANASRFAEKMRKKVESLEIKHPSSKISGNVTISLGVASTIPGREEKDWGGLVSAADSELYRAKEAGRNCIKAPNRT